MCHRTAIVLHVETCTRRTPERTNGVDEKPVPNYKAADMLASFSEFDAAYARQYQNDGQGWYEACVTMDGRTRLRRRVRVCSESCRRLGETVRDGGDGRMGSDVRRWPQSLFDATLQTRSPVARLHLHNMFTATPTDDRTITHIRRSDYSHASVYRGMPTAIPLRWRLDPDGRHMQLQLARQVNNASEWRQHLIEVGRPDLAKLKFPSQSGEAYPIEFANENNLALETIIAALSPRPMVFRVPLVNPTTTKTHESVRRGVWKTIDSPRVVRAAETTTIDGVALTWCALTGECRIKSLPTDDERVLPITNVRRDESGVVNADHDNKRISWHVNSDARAPTSEEMRQHLVRMCSPHSVKQPHVSLPRMEHVVNVLNDGKVVRRVKAIEAGSTVATARLIGGPYSQKAAGVLFTTDEALSSGFPHTHSSDRTLSFDPEIVDAEHMNDANRACIVQTDTTTRASMLALLDGLSNVNDYEFLIAETDDPVWRAQLAAILKMAPLGGLGPPPELERCLAANDHVCLSPDERVLRVQKREWILPIVKGKDMMTLAAPAFKDAVTFRNMNVTPTLLDKLLLSVDVNRHEVDVQLRLDPSTQTLYVAPGEAWKNDAVLGFRRKRWINCLKPIHVAIDTFCELPHPLYSTAAGFLIKTTSGDAGVVDNCVCRDHRTLALPESAAYGCTGCVASNTLIRPFPSPKDLDTMRSFCASPDADALF